MYTSAGTFIYYCMYWVGYSAGGLCPRGNLLPSS